MDIERSEMSPQFAEVEESINPAQQVIERNVSFEIKRVEQPVLIAALLTHHLDVPLRIGPPLGHRCAPPVRRSFSTESANRRRSALPRPDTRNHQQRSPEATLRLLGHFEGVVQRIDDAAVPTALIACSNVRLLARGEDAPCLALSARRSTSSQAAVSARRAHRPSAISSSVITPITVSVTLGT